MRNQPRPHTGRHFLQIPGPTNVPDRVLHAIALATIDHRGPEFGELGKEIVAGMRRVFRTEGTVVIYPSSGTGAWEAGLVNTLSPGDRVLMFETGHFATLWRQMATRLGLDIDFVPGDWRHGVDPAQVSEKLAAGPEHRVKAVGAVANGARLQRGFRQGAHREQGGETDALLLGLAGDGRDRAHRLFSLYAVDQPAVRAARGADDAARRGGIAGRLPSP